MQRSKLKTPALEKFTLEMKLFEIWAKEETYHKFDLTLFSEGMLTPNRTYLDIPTEICFRAFRHNHGES